MIREILFKAKRVDNGEWVEGAYYKQDYFYGDEVEKHIIITSSDALTNDFDLDFYKVIPETLGQFTGLTDKNGKRIFEGDIVRVKGVKGDENWKDYDEIGKAVFVDGAFLIEVPKEYNGIKHYSKIHSYYMTTADWVTREVVGNRFDNPELLTAERSDNEN